MSNEKDLIDFINLVSGLPSNQRQEVMDIVARIITVDPLTSVLNRRGLENRLNIEIERAKRKEIDLVKENSMYKRNSPFKGLSILMLDLDFFKHYNDTFGHHQGDEALKYTGQLLKTVIRSVDAIGRYGGEEFMLILPDTDTIGAKRVASNVLGKMEGTAIGFYVGEDEKKPKKYHGEKGFESITASIGISNYPATTSDINALVKSADNSLYQAKNTGRNRIVIHNQPIELPTHPSP